MAEFAELTFKRPPDGGRKLIKNDRVPHETKKFMGFKNPKAPASYFWVRFNDMLKEAHDGVWTVLGLNDSVTVARIMIHPETGEWVIAVRREWKYIPQRYVTVSCGCGYRFKTEKSDQQKTTWRKVLEESGFDPGRSSPLISFNANYGHKSWAYPQNVKGSQNVLVEVMPALPWADITKESFLIPLFETKELLAEPGRLALYRQDVTEHGPFARAVLAARLFVQNSLEFSDKYGVAKSRDPQALKEAIAQYKKDVV